MITRLKKKTGKNAFISHHFFFHILHTLSYIKINCANIDQASYHLEDFYYVIHQWTQFHKNPGLLIKYSLEKPIIRLSIFSYCLGNCKKYLRLLYMLLRLGERYTGIHIDNAFYFTLFCVYSCWWFSTLKNIDTSRIIKWSSSFISNELECFVHKSFITKFETNWKVWEMERLCITFHN